MILVTGSILARKDTVDRLLELSLEHVRRSRAEPGCRSHAVHRDAEDPLRLVFAEEWDSREALAAHFRVPGSREFVAAVAELAAEPPAMSIHDATPIEASELATPAAAGLSWRGGQIAAKPPLPEYLQENFARVGSLFDPVDNPEGFIPLSVAENRQVKDRLIERLGAVRDVPAKVLAYDSMIGSLEFRQRLARFLGRRVLGRQVGPEQIAVLAGAGSVLEILFHCLGDPGDGVLVPTPSYAGFWADLETRDQLKIVPVPTESKDGFRLTPSHLDRALASAGRPVKALLFTSPNNPLGTVYSAAEVEEVLSWARGAGIHVVLDEIYALSVHGESEFVSGAHRLRSLGDSVHVVWAFSKDFGASGLRCGVLVSENQDLIRAVDGLAYWACCSGHTQHLLGEAIDDDAWVDDYLAASQAALAASYRATTEALRREDIPYLPAEAGFFVMCDFRRFFEQPTWAAEHALWRRLLDEGNVNLTPGKACRSPEPGWMRLCFASRPAATVATGIRRVGAILRG